MHVLRSLTFPITLIGEMSMAPITSRNHGISIFLRSKYFRVRSEHFIRNCVSYACVVV